LSEANQPINEILVAAETILRSVGRRRDAEHSPVSRLMLEEEQQFLRQPHVLGERSSLLALWKPPGWTVSVFEATDYDNLQLQEPEEGLESVESSGQPLQEWVVEQLGAAYPICNDSSLAHGLLHRLDRNTSGALLCSKTYEGYFVAKLQFAARRVLKCYVCLCHGILPMSPRLLNTPLHTVREHGGGRSVADPTGQKARTFVNVVVHLGLPGQLVSLVQVELGTGRYHQIRAHFTHDGHPLVGDIHYGGWVPRHWCQRVFLHAYRLAIDVGDGVLETMCPLPQDLHDSLAQVAASDFRSRATQQSWLLM